MPLNYLDLKPQVEGYAETAVSRSHELAHKLQDCLKLLEKYDNQLPALNQAVEQAVAQNKGLRCADPIGEPLHTHLPAVLPAPACTLLAADGSQINPDPHGQALYGLINVGVYRVQPGSGEAPQTRIFTTLLTEEDLQSEAGLASEDLIALRRDARERQIMAELAKNEPTPLVTLTDGPLELYREPRQDKNFKKYFNQYISALNELALLRTVVAGYVDRPRADLVVKLLELTISQKVDERPFKGITDLALYQTLLAPGERSAVFRLQSSSADAFENKSLHFFYINVGSAGQPALARVEVPLWVVEDAPSMSLLQSVLVEQAAQAGSRPYPYPLLRAHEIAVVKMDDHDQVNQLIEAELLKLGLPPALNSNKQSHKQHSARGRM